VLDIKGERFAEMFEDNQRRVWIPLAEVPDHVRNAFIAAEDRRFYQHKGVDERGLIRAFVSSLAQSGRPEGGSTITQQLVKNLLVGDNRTYERKIREMIVAARVESTLTKDEILELYLNSIYLGRGSWGIELAARSYFGKSARELAFEEGALLAGLTKGPNYFSPDRQPVRAQGAARLCFGQDARRWNVECFGKQRAAQQTGITATACANTLSAAATRYRLPFRRRRGPGSKIDSGDQCSHADSYTIRSTINSQLQRAVEESLQEGLFRYESGAGRLEFRVQKRTLAKPSSGSRQKRNPPTSGRRGSRPS